MNTRKLLYIIGVCSLSFLPGKMLGQIGSSMNSDSLQMHVTTSNDSQDKEKVQDLESQLKQAESNLDDAQRVEKDARSAVKEAKAAIRAEKKAQDARKRADRQAKNAAKAKEVSDENKY